MRYWAGKVLGYTIIINLHNQGRFTIFEISFHYYNFWRSEVDFTWDMRPWVSFAMILQSINQVSWILWLRLRTHAWYARLAWAFGRSSVINTAGSKAWFSSYSRSSSDRSSSCVWSARIIFGSRSRSSFLWAITCSLARLLTNLTRSGLGAGVLRNWLLFSNSMRNGDLIYLQWGAQLHLHIAEFDHFLVCGACVVFRQPINPDWVTPPMLLKIIN